MADKKIMLDGSVDIGNNIAGLIEKLGQQIGVAGDKIFPWYVKQQVIDGWIFIIATVFFFVVLGVVFFVAFKKMPKGKIEDEDAPVVVTTVVTGISLVICFIALIVGGSNAVRQIVNPEYYAITAMTKDMSRLLHR